MTWKTIDGFPHYEINEHGEVRSWRKKELHWRNPEVRPGWRDIPVVLSGTIARHGYKVYILRDKDGKKRRCLAHRLVAFTFLGEPASADLTDVAHNDGNAGNNHVSNLRWSTHRDNQLDMWRHGTMQDGEKSITAKIDEATARRIRERGRTEPRGVQRRMAKELGLSVAQVCRIVNNTRWRGID